MILIRETARGYTRDMESSYGDTDRNGSALPIRVPPYVLGALSSCAIFGLAIVLVRNPHLFDWPLTKIINHEANRSQIFDVAFYDLDHYNTFSGLLLMAFVWFCWFGVDLFEEHARILVGTLLAFPVGMLSRFLQHQLSTHPRPFYDPAFGFIRPSMLDATPLNTWNSFPSDHATAFGALVIVIMLQRPRLGWFVIPWFVLLECARVYMGAHYPSDLIGGVALAGIVVLAAQAPWVIHIGQRVVRWERSSPSWFYMLAFLLSSQVATLFSDLRYMAGGVKLLRLIKLW